MDSAWATVIVGVLSLAGTIIGTLVGIRKSNDLITYKIEELQKKVEKHNNLIDRTYKLEKDMDIAFQMIKNSKQDIEEEKQDINIIKEKM